MSLSRVGYCSRQLTVSCDTVIGWIAWSGDRRVKQAAMIEIVRSFITYILHERMTCMCKELVN